MRFSMEEFASCTCRRCSVAAVSRGPMFDSSRGAAVQRASCAQPAEFVLGAMAWVPECGGSVFRKSPTI